jgi:hypothetical protein
MLKKQETETVKVGDMIWQSRMPGGMCLLLEMWDDWGAYKKQLNERLPDAGDPIWNEHDFPVLQVLHPTEGVIQDPSYYYSTVDEAEKYGRRRLKYELEQAGREAPEWLLKEIAEDETR